MRLRLAFLVAGTVLPLISFAIGLIYLDYVQDRDAAFNRVLQTAQGIRLVLDRETQSIAYGLQVLALSQALERGDLDGFRRDVTTFLSQYPPDTAISLARRDGLQVLNSRLPPDAPPRRRADLESLEQVFRTGRPAFSKLYTGTVSQRPLITINVPVFRNGDVVYDLGINPATSTFQRLVEQQRPGPDWTIAIFDRTGINFAREPAPEKTVGERASPTLYAALFDRNEAKLITRSLEGVELITAFTRSPLSDWTVAAGMPTAAITAPLWRTLATTAGTGTILLLIGLAFALRMATRVARGEALQALLVNEVNHRVKNTLATVQALAAQTFREPADPKEARKRFNDRLMALGRAHDVLSAEKWDGASLRDIVEGVLEPYGLTAGDRITLSGPDLRVEPHYALILSMVLHELATNAAKYGALSNDTGRVSVAWGAGAADARHRLRVTWREEGGPAVVPVRRRGFGSILIERSFGHQTGGRGTLSFDPSGVVCSLEFAGAGDPAPAS